MSAENSITWYIKKVFWLLLAAFLALLVASAVAASFKAPVPPISTLLDSVRPGQSIIDSPRYKAYEAASGAALCEQSVVYIVLFVVPVLTLIQTAFGAKSKTARIVAGFFGIMASLFISLFNIAYAWTNFHGHYLLCGLSLLACGYVWISTIRAILGREVVRGLSRSNQSRKKSIHQVKIDQANEDQSNEKKKSKINWW